MSETAIFSVLGLNHKTAPVAVREQLALGGDLTAGLLRTFHRENVFEEAMIVDTCNRTEVYFVPQGEPDALGYFLEHVARLKQTPAVDDRTVFYRYDGLDAVRHLFRVASSLDSQIVGEHEILGQVKTAYRRAVEAQTARFFLNKLSHWAFHVGKRVQTETALGRGSSGVAEAAVELVQQVFSRLSGTTVLLVGAGQTAESAARTLVREGAARLIVANRTVEHARVLARLMADAAAAGGNGQPEIECPAIARMLAGLSPEPTDMGSRGGPRLATEAISLEEIPAVLADVDLVISSTAAPGYVLTYDAVKNHLSRRGEPLLIMDIAMPRDVETRVGDLPNVFLYNLDDLDLLVTSSLGRRRQEVPRAEALVEDEVQQFSKWLGSRQVAPTIQLLQQHFEALQQLQVNKYKRQFHDAQHEELAQFTDSLCRKILHSPIAYLHELSANAAASEVLATVETVRRLFGLDSQEPHD
jgi:glutamyl-tRNA reductase